MCDQLNVKFIRSDQLNAIQTHCRLLQSGRLRKRDETTTCGRIFLHVMAAPGNRDLLSGKSEGRKRRRPIVVPAK